MLLRSTILLLILGSCAGTRRAAERDEGDLTECPRGSSIFKVTESNGRVTKVVAHIYKKDLDTGSEPTAKTRRFKNEQGCESDDAGHIIANRLGGCGNASGNIFPQDPHVNRGEWKSVENQVAQEVENLTSSRDYVKYTVQLVYANPTRTRPYMIRYDAQKVEDGEKPVEITRGWVPNKKGKKCVPTV